MHPRDTRKLMYKVANHVRSNLRCACFVSVWIAVVSPCVSRLCGGERARDGLGEGTGLLRLVNSGCVS